ncbi:tomoregulin-2-like isoform X2 [Branchiostoma floridae]|uniref:Tomoregulin-2-like isoform X2 n=1 Tax=Branchiostoma floridae TaxID=7739 RepID=A0A9J7LE52_BRAFL|nr:tomoregulin-2-like isoform X2 [Branchiostoma floridae]
MRPQSVWNVLLAVGYWCLIQVAKAQIQTEEERLDSSTAPTSLGLMRTKMPDRYTTTQLPCPSRRYDGFCLNGGVCLTVQVGHNHREPRCECPIDYIGRRCERSNPLYLETQSGKPEDKNYVIAGAVCGGIIILALVGIICILVSWKRERQARQNSRDPEKNRPENGHLTEGDN